MEKQRNLSNKQHRTSTPLSNAPGWNEHLASASEASVKVGMESHPFVLTYLNRILARLIDQPSGRPLNFKRKPSNTFARATPLTIVWNLQRHTIPGTRFLDRSALPEGRKISRMFIKL